MKRAPRRPRLDEDDESVPVHVKMPSRQYDATYSRAQSNGVSVQEQIRRDVAHASEGEKKTGRP